MADADFLFMTCQLGAERALKDEVARWRPDLRFAFSRPGLLTFKAPGPLPHDVQVPCVFARVSGVSLGRAAGAAEVADVLAARLPAGCTLRLHGHARDAFRPGDEPAGWSRHAATAGVLAGLEPLLVARGFKVLPSGGRAETGERVVDIIGGDPGEPFLLGTRVLGRYGHAFPGGHTPVEMPAESPSRAYVKLEEALAWGRAPVLAGDHAVELGSAPGGAALALVRRGVHVTGVDPAVMDPRVLGFRGPGGAACTHLQRVMSDVQRAELPAAMHWVVADVNAAPQVVLGTVERFCARPRHALMGVLLTLKLDDWKAARHVPRLLERVEKLGMEEVRATQLAGNRMEIHVTGLTAAALARGTPRS